MEGRATISRNVIMVRVFGIKILEILWGGIPSYTPRSLTCRHASPVDDASTVSEKPHWLHANTKSEQPTAAQDESSLPDSV